MSTRAIAPVVGVDRSNVIRDLQVVQSAPPAPTEAPAPLPTSDTITAMDGKEYPRPAPAPGPARRRQPLTDQARDAGWELHKATERIQRVAEHF